MPSAQITRMGSTGDVEFVTVHGHRRAYRMAGSGPALLLLHGLGSDHTTWNPVFDKLARQHTVIAPDFLGHGQSDKPRADYSIGGYANGMRDLLTIFGIDKVTVVGHSFGGGVAMQFAYQYPERTERLVLVASGGLGREVTPVIRAVTLPGFPLAAGVLTLPGLRQLATGGLRRLGATGLNLTRDLGEVANIIDGWQDPGARRAIQHVVRNCVDLSGQIITMRDRAYLTEAMPICVIWGRDDLVLPVRHAEIAAEIAPTAHVEVMDHAGHFPQRDHPDRFVKVLNTFVRTTAPASYRRAKWRSLMVQGAHEPASESDADTDESPPAAATSA